MAFKGSAMDEKTIEETLRRAGDLSREKRFADAEAVLKTVLEERPGDRGALDLLGFVLFFQKRYGEAEAVCARSLAYHPDNAYAMNGYGLCLARQGRVDEGLRSIRRAIETSPGWFDPYWDFLSACGEHGRKREAAEIYSEALRRFPGARDRLLRLARRYSLIGSDDA